MDPIATPVTRKSSTTRIGKGRLQTFSAGKTINGPSRKIYRRKTRSSRDAEMRRKIQHRRKNTGRVLLSVFPRQPVITSRPGIYISWCKKYVKEMTSRVHKIMRQKGCILDVIWNLTELEAKTLKRYNRLRNLTVDSEEQLDQQNDLLEDLEAAILKIQTKMAQKESQRDLDRLKWTRNGRIVCCKACAAAFK